MTDEPLIRPGEVAGWPKLVITYVSDPTSIASLLPPGIEPLDPVATIAFYCVPVLDEPEYGVSVKVAASWKGQPGQYTLGIGIDQEAAVHVSAETNGQPKYLCDVRFFRLGDTVQARATHQGHTFVEYSGRVVGLGEPRAEAVTEHEWWTKYSRAIGGAEGAYDFPPHVVDVATTLEQRHIELVEGDLMVRDSPWDPIVRYLPVSGRSPRSSSPTDRRAAASPTRGRSTLPRSGRTPTSSAEADGRADVADLVVPDRDSGRPGAVARSVARG